MAHPPKPGVDEDTGALPLHTDDTSHEAASAESDAHQAAAEDDAQQAAAESDTQEAAPTSPPEPAERESAVDASNTADSTPETPPRPANFEDLALPDALRRAIAGLGWDKPTPVQLETFDPLVQGRDVLVQSQTGSGKTGAFCIPWLAGRFEDRPARETGVQLLVLVPTRELAKQVCGVLRALGEHSGVTPLPVYGGTAMQPQLQALRDGVHAVVGTPGRILDHIRRRSLDLSKVRTVVLDEADEMLSMGFLEDIHAILESCPRERQTCLFSATVPPDIERIARRSMRDPVAVRLSGDQIAAAQIGHNYYTVSGALRTRDLLDIIALEEPVTALIFCNTREETNVVASVLQREGYQAAALSSDLSQVARERVLGWMRSGQLRFLVATDVASRGIDISHISHVINYSFPENAESYIHRTGRTGRAGRIGQATSLIAPQDLGNFYYLKLQYPTLSFEERELPSKEELERQRQENKLDHVSKLFPELVSPEWTLLARNLMRDPRGEQVIAYLLSQGVTAHQTRAPRILDEDEVQGSEADARAPRGDGDRYERRPERGRRDRGERWNRGERGGDRSRSDARGGDAPHEPSERGEGHRGRRRDRSRGEVGREGLAPSETREALPEHRGDAELESAASEHVEPAVDVSDELTAAEGAAEVSDGGAGAAAESVEESRHRRRRRRRRGERDDRDTLSSRPAATADDAATGDAVAEGDAPEDDEGDTELASDTDSEAAGASDEGAEPSGRRRKRRRRRRSGGRGPQAEGTADAVPEAPAAQAVRTRGPEGSDETEEGRKRRRRRRRGGGGAAEVAKHVPQDQIIIDIDESELEIVRGEFGEIDELDDLTLKGRRRGVMEALEDEVELEDVSVDDAPAEASASAETATAEPRAATSTREEANGVSSEDSSEGDDESDDELAADDDAKADDDPRAKRKRKRRRKRAKKKEEAVAAAPELSAPPHKDFWEVWASRFTYRDFEDEALGDDYKVEEEIPPAALEPVFESEDGVFVTVSLNCGRKHGKKAADVRELLASRLGLEGRSVRNLTVSETDTQLRVHEAQVSRLMQGLTGFVLDEIRLEVTLVEDQDSDHAGTKATDTDAVADGAELSPERSDVRSSDDHHNDSSDDDDRVARHSTDASTPADGAEAASDAPIP